MNINDSIKRASKAVGEAGAILICAGAGIGVDSGLPDFRGNEGFWKAYPPIARLGISFSQMANPEWFRRDPKLAWAFYGHRLDLYRKTKPHEGYNYLLEAAETKPGGYFIFTSNVDGHFQKAGFTDEYIDECHGSIHYLQCNSPCCDSIWDAEEIALEIDDDKFHAMEPLPECKHCGLVARPNILMFGDWSWVSDRFDLQSRRLSQWLSKVTENNYKLVIIEIGAGEAVPTVRHMSERIALRMNAALIRINPRDFDVPNDQIAIPLGVLESVKKIFD